MAIVTVALFCATGLSGDLNSKTIILIEAESFTDPGGWVNDQQFMDQMGSPYLLAHGLGVPVKDAETTVTIPEDGKYRLWVRTRDWVAQWTNGTLESPGRFEVLIDNKPVKTIFGTEGANWHWQDGGSEALKQGDVILKLHDLTGFEGRCDAILLSSDPQFTPPTRRLHSGGESCWESLSIRQSKAPTISWLRAAESPVLQHLCRRQLSGLHVPQSMAPVRDRHRRSRQPAAAAGQKNDFSNWLNNLLTLKFSRQSG